jgi:protein arginine kinase activator
MHKGTSHVGQVHARLQRTLQFNAEMKTLQQNLARAVADEKYEDAAEIRDRIKLLETQLNS